MALRSDDFHDVRMSAPEESAHRDRCQEVSEQDLLPGDRLEDSLREQHGTHEKAEFEEHEDQEDAESCLRPPLGHSQKHGGGGADQTEDHPVDACVDQDELEGDGYALEGRERRAG